MRVDESLDIGVVDEGIRDDRAKNTRPIPKGLVAAMTKKEI
jgi:hypothetical protein